jgi:hypothetical protein
MGTICHTTRHSGILACVLHSFETDLANCNIPVATICTDLSQVFAFTSRKSCTCFHAFNEPSAAPPTLVAQEFDYM